MKQTDEIRLVQQWLAALNRSDWEAFGAFLASDARFTFTHRLPDKAATLHGREVILGSHQGWRSGFSNLTGEITDGFSSGNRVAVQLWWTGTTATAGNPVGFAACFLITINDGQIATIVDFYDQLTYDAQFDA